MPVNDSVTTVSSVRAVLLLLSFCEGSRGQPFFMTIGHFHYPVAISGGAVKPVDSLLCGNREDLQTLKHIAAQAREFTDNDRIIGL